MRCQYLAGAYHFTGLSSLYEVCALVLRQFDEGVHFNAFVEGGADDAVYVFAQLFGASDLELNVTLDRCGFPSASDHGSHL